jgi:dsDNA-specific endonuclease/ATPase MutS2
MVEKAKEQKFKIGDRVGTLSGDEKGTVARLGRDEDAVQVRWDGGQQQLMLVSDLKKEESK